MSSGFIIKKNWYPWNYLDIILQSIGDGIPDSQDEDIDGDGIPNKCDDDIDGKPYTFRFNNITKQRK